MASAAGVAGVRATLDLGSKSSKCVQCGEPDSARITRHPEVGLSQADLWGVIRPTSCLPTTMERGAVASQSIIRALPRRVRLLSVRVVAGYSFCMNAAPG